MTKSRDWAEATALSFDLHANSQHYIQRVLAGRTQDDRALALADLLHYLGIHRSSEHPPPRRHPKRNPFISERK